MRVVGADIASTDKRALSRLYDLGVMGLAIVGLSSLIHGFIPSNANDFETPDRRSPILFAIPKPSVEVKILRGQTWDLVRRVKEVDPERGRQLTVSMTEAGVDVSEVTKVFALAASAARELRIASNQPSSDRPKTSSVARQRFE